ncbi:sulfotransferase family protein [Flocculibacter collagenilyticus]|uniref:sulfotransferase family protein n=1 Tax=Flocculibacter collagenilyticus TaxID=2744479 RepID=UPI0018F372EE|nr:sulfotransferase family protein [Flocculibacter collagenilyticus]
MTECNTTPSQSRSSATRKYFIIGLPRTATTSVCVAALKLGFKTAHTAYVKEAFEQAEVIADTPIFCDYPQLAEQYPAAKFIYLTRKPEKWLPSIKQLLQRMYVNLQRQDGGFNPILKRCYNEVFFPLTLDNIDSDDFLLGCYVQHQTQIEKYFKSAPERLLTIDVSEAGSFATFTRFLNASNNVNEDAGFEVVNTGNKVTTWKSIKHPLKVESTRNGKVDSGL